MKVKVGGVKGTSPLMQRAATGNLTFVDVEAEHLTGNAVDLKDKYLTG